MSNQKSIEALRDKFHSSWEPMIALMNRAREIEFRVRITAEILSNRAFANAKSFDDFMKGSRKSEIKKMEKHIKDLFGKDQERLILIRQCTDSLAHADYIAARRRIDQYQNKFGLESPLTNQPVGIILINNVKEPDGPEKGGVADIGYLLSSSEENLILEEFEVFKHQGYQVAAEEMMTYAEESLLKIAPKIELKYAALVASRGLKYGQRRYKNV